MAKRDSPKVEAPPAPRPSPAPRATGGGRPTERGLPTESIVIDTSEGGAEEHRQFPRAKLSVPFHLWIGEGNDRKFEATLQSLNVSVSGAFLHSTFFVPSGTELSVSFQLLADADPVRGKVEVVREERPGRDGDESRSGMGVRFVAFDDQSEVTLARLFLGDALREFVDEFLSSSRAKSLGSEFERVVDALAAWELRRVTRPGDPWRMAPPPTPAPARARRGR